MTISFLLLVTFASCKKSSSNPLQIAVASSVAVAVNDLKKDFSKQTGIEVSIITGASGQLAAQIEQGASFDIFMSADESYADSLIDQNLAINKYIYGKGALVLITSKLNIDSIEDILSSDIRFISIANPKHAPYGKAAYQLLTHLNLWETIRNRIVYGSNVRQTLQHFQTKNADAAFVSRSILSHTNYISISEHLYPAIVHAAVLCSFNNKKSLLFLNYLRSKKAKDILQTHGISPYHKILP